MSKLFKQPASLQQIPYYTIIAGSRVYPIIEKDGCYIPVLFEKTNIEWNILPSNIFIYDPTQLTDTLEEMYSYDPFGDNMNNMDHLLIRLPQPAKHSSSLYYFDCILIDNRSIYMGFLVHFKSIGCSANYGFNFKNIIHMMK